MANRVIFSNYPNEVEEMINYIRGNLEEFFDETYDVSEEKILSRAYDELEINFEAETMNLDRRLDGRVLVIADLGFWNGRRPGYRILGRNLNEILTVGEDYFEVYVENGKTLGRTTHHDGTHYFEFREIREDRNIERLLDMIYHGEEISRHQLNYYTKSLTSYIYEIYGWGSCGKERAA